MPHDVSDRAPHECACEWRYERDAAARWIRFVDADDAETARAAFAVDGDRRAKAHHVGAPSGLRHQLRAGDPLLERCAPLRDHREHLCAIRVGGDREIALGLCAFRLQSFELFAQQPQAAGSDVVGHSRR